MSISLCMIARDEEEFIGNAIKSAMDLVDEIIIIDTGSKDKTIDIARSLGAIVKESLWKKDFAHHRNESIKLATSDWILFLDCDEILNYEDISKVKDILEGDNNSIKGYNLNIVNVVDGKNIASFESLRIFKNREGFEFVNPIHEQIIPSITKKYGDEVIARLPLTILHYGYENKVELKKDKRKRNLEILNNIKEKDGYFYTMLGNEYLQSNDLINAANNYKLSFERINNFNSSYIPNLIVNYITTLVNLKEYSLSLQVIDYSKKYLPKFRDLYFLSFWIYFYSNFYSQALDNLNIYINLINNDRDSFGHKNFYEIYNLEELKEICINKLSNNK